MNSEASLSEGLLVGVNVGFRSTGSLVGEGSSTGSKVGEALKPEGSIVGLMEGTGSTGSMLGERVGCLV